MSKRQYTLKQRAAKQAETRSRIVDAIVELHEEVGPRATTVKAIAERAGVERLTVYRHFPEEAGMFQACSARFLELNPPPDPATCIAGKSPRAKTRKLLTSLYAYYRRTERMFSRVYRDADDLPALQSTLQEFESYLASLRDELLLAWPHDATARSQISAVLSHALTFSTWASFKAQGLADEHIAELFNRWLDALAE